MQYFDLGILTRRINYFCWKVSIILYYSLYKQQDKPWDWFCEGGLTLNRQYKKVEHSDREVSRYRRCRILHKLSIFIILSSANFFSFFIIGITFLALSAVLLLSFVYFLNINRSTCLFTTINIYIHHLYVKLSTWVSCLSFLRELPWWPTSINGASATGKIIFKNYLKLWLFKSFLCSLYIVDKVERRCMFEGHSFSSVMECYISFAIGTLKHFIKNALKAWLTRASFSGRYTHVHTIHYIRCI